LIDLQEIELGWPVRTPIIYCQVNGWTRDASHKASSSTAARSTIELSWDDIRVRPRHSKAVEISGGAAENRTKRILLIFEWPVCPWGCLITLQHCRWPWHTVTFVSISNPWQPDSSRHLCSNKSFM